MLHTRCVVRGVAFTNVYIVQLWFINLNYERHGNVLFHGWVRFPPTLIEIKENGV